MKKLLFIALLPAASAWAAPRLFSAGGSPNAVTTTTADMSLYVDGVAGSDLNSCTRPTTACATPQAALNKAPKHLEHALNVYIDGGAYPGFYVSGFTYDPSVQQASGGITIQGAMKNATLASGLVTGTVASSTAGANGTFGTVNVTGAGWTANDLIGKFFVATSGPLAGFYVEPIYANSAASLTLTDLGDAVNLAGNTFAIQEPATRITSPVTAPGYFGTPYAGIAYVGAPGLSLTLQNIGVQVSATPYGILHQGSGFLTVFNDTVYDGPTAANVRIDPAPGQFLNFTASSSISTSVDDHFAQLQSDPTTAPVDVAVSNGLFKGGSISIMLGHVGLTGQYVGITGVTSMGLGMNGGLGRGLIALNVTCGGTGDAIAVGLGAVVDGLLEDDQLVYGTPSIGIMSGVFNNCGTVLAIAGGSQAEMYQVSGTNRVGAYMLNGGRVFVTRGQYALDAGTDFGLERGNANAPKVTAMLTDIPDRGCIVTSVGTAVCERLFQTGGAGWRP